jgi:2-methylcitrate dehydratase PrpD
MDPVVTLAEHVCHTRFDDLPASAVVATQRDILDTLGAAIGGSGAPGIAILAELARRWGGAPESTVWVLGGRFPAPQAALVNAAMGHALDFDDTFDRAGNIHPGVATLAATLAMAELGENISGREVVLAVTLGLDVACRLALAATVDRGWHRTAAIGIFGAVAAAGKILQLNVAQMIHAFGIAYSQAAGNRQCIVDGALTKRLQAGQAASSGVLAALLAGEGFTGAQEVFAGRYGFFPIYQPEGYHLEAITASLGTAFRGEELSFKPYPCGRGLHALLDAALALYHTLELATAAAGADIAEILVSTDAATYSEQFAPGTTKRRPTQVVEAQFSIPFLVAAALALGRVGIGEVAGVNDARVLALAARIQGTVRPQAPRGWAALTVRRTDGRQATRETAAPSGSPAQPLTTAQLEAKFRDCAAHAVRPLSEAVVIRLMADVQHLEELPTISALLQLLQP